MLIDKMGYAILLFEILILIILIERLLILTHAISKRVILDLNMNKLFRNSCHKKGAIAQLCKTHFLHKNRKSTRNDSKKISHFYQIDSLSFVLIIRGRRRVT